MVNTIGNVAVLEAVEPMLNPRSLIALRIAEYEARTGEKLKHEWIAKELLKVTPQHFSACVNSRAFLKMDKAFKLSRFFGCTVDELHHYEEE